MAKKDDTKRDRVREVYASAGGYSARKTARLTGCDRAWITEVCADLTPPADGPELSREFRERADGTADLALVTDKPIRTLDDLIRAAEIDLSVWWVESWEASAWTVVVKEEKKLDGAKIKRPVRTQQHRVKARLKRVQPRALHDATEAIFARMAKHAPDYSKAKINTLGSVGGEPTLAVLGLFDVHFGKLAWGRETGESYDLDIASAVFANAVEDMLAESAHRNVVKYLIPLGNDFYHLDNAQNKTVNGTPQDVDGRYGKVIEAGEIAVIAAIERLAERAEVQVVWVPGNHDYTTSYHLARTVRAWFHRHKRVTVDAEPSPRKYVTFGATLLGLTHGDVERHEDLPDIMANERPAEWAGATCREWLIGHFHHSRRYTTKDAGQRRGTTVRILRSLSGVDAWHHKHAYVNSDRAAEVYHYGKLTGYRGHALAYARQ